jgi:hypothetical protein
MRHMYKTVKISKKSTKESEKAKSKQFNNDMGAKMIWELRSTLYSFLKL